MTLTTGAPVDPLLVSRARPTLLSAENLAVTKTVDGITQPPGPDWTGNYQLGWSTSEWVYPTTYITGPALSSALPVGVWLIWAAINPLSGGELPATPLGWVRVVD